MTMQTIDRSICTEGPLCGGIIVTDAITEFCMLLIWKAIWSLTSRIWKIMRVGDLRQLEIWES